MQLIVCNLFICYRDPFESICIFISIQIYSDTFGSIACSDDHAGCTLAGSALMSMEPHTITSYYEANSKNGVSQ